MKNAILGVESEPEPVVVAVSAPQGKHFIWVLIWLWCNLESDGQIDVAIEPIVFTFSTDLFDLLILQIFYQLAFLEQTFPFSGFCFYVYCFRAKGGKLLWFVGNLILEFELLSFRSVFRSSGCSLRPENFAGSSRHQVRSRDERRQACGRVPLQNVPSRGLYFL